MKIYINVNTKVSRSQTKNLILNNLKPRTFLKIPGSINIDDK